MENASSVEVVTFAVAVACVAGIAADILKRRQVIDYSQLILFGVALVFVVSTLVAMQVPTANSTASYIMNAMRVVGVLLVTCKVFLDSQRG